MTRTLNIAFTGNAVLTPAYSDPPRFPPIDGPLVAVLPGARRVRRSTFPTDQINAQFAFLKFPYRHLVRESGEDRDADYKHPDLRNVKAGLCIFEEEDLQLVTRPKETQLTFDPSATTDPPTIGSSGTGYIARWGDFAAGGESRIRDNVLQGNVDAVRVTLPGGKVTAGFVAEPIARINFDYGDSSPTLQYAQQIVVTLTFDDIEEVTFSVSRRGGPAAPSVLRFRWYDSPNIDLLFGNGSLTSILNTLSGSFVGQDHEGDFDVEFEVLYDIVHVTPDHLGRRPLPQIKSVEVLRVPCIASMIDSEPQTSAAPAPEVLPAVPNANPREPGEPRRRSGGRIGGNGE